MAPGAWRFYTEKPGLVHRGFWRKPVDLFPDDDIIRVIAQAGTTLEFLDRLEDSAVALREGALQETYNAASKATDIDLIEDFRFT